MNFNTFDEFPKKQTMVVSPIFLLRQFPPEGGSVSMANMTRRKDENVSCLASAALPNQYGSKYFSEYVGARLATVFP